MARKLPWDRDQVDTPAKVGKSPAQAPRSPVIANPSSEPAKRVKRRSPSRTRSPSTSPPPEPPKEEYMTPTDDLWQMVEDEFYQTAQKFTAHLHRAEYQRQKTLAASQNAAAISAIARPTVGEASSLVRQRSALTSRAQRQKNVLGEEVPATSGLRGLMDSPKKADRVLRSHAHPMAGKQDCEEGAEHGWSRNPRRSHHLKGSNPTSRPGREAIIDDTSFQIGTEP
ncbi:uncharacterized protein J7T54_004472 [Emericellopsis cladophorae]|uniref:Uncharacterized protein n=1 Tax=Emericellopsis cladophorae TaxID=2686198 RepID=A0A9P9Y4Z7_9HYPO|nr:uncharacterized protein J7T54_004472 [Emericellopsis cladophorae]KAI6783445.1 hypothetical protein J7T54_004472 [Emericellopsis cladophorae]